jgi:hypothetical protein
MLALWNSILLLQRADRPCVEVGPRLAPLPGRPMATPCTGTRHLKTPMSMNVKRSGATEVVVGD